MPHPHTLIGVRCGYSLFEHGTRGDESPILIRIDGAFHETGFYEMPDIEDILDIVAEIRRFGASD